MILDLAPMATAIHKKIERSSKFGRMKRMKLWLCNMYMNYEANEKNIVCVYSDEIEWIWKENKKQLKLLKKKF
jgi:hypothetical protein